MANKHKHVEKALSNEAFLPVIARHDGHYDWYITTVFYAGVHWVRAYLADAGIGAADAEEIIYDDFPRHIRAIYRGVHGNIEAADDVIDEFASLKRLSRRSRYACMAPSWYAQRTGDAEAHLSALCAFVGKQGIDTSDRKPFP